MAVEPPKAPPVTVSTPAVVLKLVTVAIDGDCETALAPTTGRPFDPVTVSVAVPSTATETVVGATEIDVSAPPFCTLEDGSVTAPLRTGTVTVPTVTVDALDVTALDVAVTADVPLATPRTRIVACPLAFVVTLADRSVQAAPMSRYTDSEPAKDSLGVPPVLSEVLTPAASVTALPYVARIWSRYDPDPSDQIEPVTPASASASAPVVRSNHTPRVPLVAS